MAVKLSASAGTPIGLQLRVNLGMLADVNFAFICLAEASKFLAWVGP